jgi:hypothetical protein
MFKRNTMAVRITNAIMENHELYVFRVSVCGLIYPSCKAHAPYYVYLSSAACLALLYLFTLSHKGHYFRGKNFKYKICFDFIYNFRPKHFPF